MTHQARDGWSICVYKVLTNCLYLLPQVLGGLPCLADLELSGNPVTQVPHYKSTLLAVAPQICQLDGDTVGELDRQGVGQQEGQGQQGGGQQGSIADMLVVEHSGDKGEGEDEGAAPASRRGAALNTSRSSQHQPTPGPSGQGPGNSSSTQPEQGGKGKPAAVLNPAPTGRSLHPPPAAAPFTSTPSFNTQLFSEALRSSHSVGSVPGSGSTAPPSSTATLPGPASKNLRPGSANAGPRPGSASTGPGTGPRPGTASTGPRPGTASLGPRPGTAGGFTTLVCADQELNDHPVLLEYLARHVLAEGLAAMQQVTVYMLLQERGGNRILSFPKPHGLVFGCSSCNVYMAAMGIVGSIMKLPAPLYPAGRRQCRRLWHQAARLLCSAPACRCHSYERH